VDEQQAWLNGKTHVNSNMSVRECSSTNISNEHPPLGTSMSFPSSHSSISYASKLHASILGSNKGIPFDPGNFFEEIPGGEMSACHVPLQSPELANHPLVQIQSSSTDQVVPSSHLPLQSPELMNQPSIQIQSSSIGCSTKLPGSLTSLPDLETLAAPGQLVCHPVSMKLVKMLECLLVHHKETTSS
jgi:two-component response regulator (ARR-B family)